MQGIGTKYGNGKERDHASWGRPILLPGETRLSTSHLSALAHALVPETRRECATKGMYSSIEQKPFTFQTNTCFYIGRLMWQRARRTSHARWAGSES